MSQSHPFTEVKITDSLEQNYMPYAMSVIVSRALPEIDGFKPSHRKLLYTMYKMGLLTGGRTKSANVVGQTMRLNPHGDAAIYETMVRLSRGNGALLTPFVDSKGNFGKVYSRDMAYAAARYTEVKLDSMCSYLFADIGSDSVDFVDNYDGTTQEPLLLPTSFPNILVSANLGIAVGMASNFCGFDLNEVCRTTIEFLKNPDHDLLSTLKAPDFPTGGQLILDRAQMEEVYRTGKGSFKVRCKWSYKKKENIIEITQIPYTTTIEAIIDKVAELIKAGKIKDITDIRDESGLEGLKIAIDLKRGCDPDLLMNRLMKMTPLMDTFSCNFNVLIGGTPQVLGVREIIEEWSAWRIECVRRRVHYDLKKKTARLHLLNGLKKILLDIDKAIEIIRQTENDQEVVPNLMIGFGIDEIQADFIAEIKLRNINKEYILNRLTETAELEKEIKRLDALLKDRGKIKEVIIKELEDMIVRCPTKRHTEIVYEHMVQTFDESDAIEDYTVNLFLTKEGYFKKITPQSLRMSGEHKLKDGDEIALTLDGTNKAEIIFLTNQYHAYKAKLHEFSDTKASALGDFLPQKLGMDENELPVFMLIPGDFSGNLIYIFANGKAAKVPVSCYDTISNRRRLNGAYSDKSELVQVFHFTEEQEVALYSGSRLLLFHTSSIVPKTTRTTQGVAVMTVKKNQKVTLALPLSRAGLESPARYRTRTLPAAGSLIRPGDEVQKQLSIE